MSGKDVVFVSLLWGKTRCKEKKRVIKKYQQKKNYRHGSTATLYYAGWIGT